MEHPIQVLTTIDPNRMSFRGEPPKLLYVKDLKQTNYDLVLVLELLDKNDMPVVGKYPTKIYTSTEDPKYANDIEVQIMREHDLFCSSIDDGVMTIPIKVVKLARNNLKASIVLEIDGINATSNSIEFVYHYKMDKTLISSAKFTYYPALLFEKGAQLTEKFEFEIQQYDMLGNAIVTSDYVVQPRIFVQPVSQSPIPQSFIKYNFDDYIVEDSKMRYYNNKFIRAAAGHYYMKISVSQNG